MRVYEKTHHKHIIRMRDDTSCCLPFRSSYSVSEKKPHALPLFGLCVTPKTIIPLHAYYENTMAVDGMTIKCKPNRMRKIGRNIMLLQTTLSGLRWLVSFATNSQHRCAGSLVSVCMAQIMQKVCRSFLDSFNNAENNVCCIYAKLIDTSTRGIEHDEQG